MRNGINLAGISETVNEVRANRREGLYRYRVQVGWYGGPHLRGRVLPLHAGTETAARNFSFDIASGSKPRAGLLVHTPIDLLLTGVGGCVMITSVMGLTTQGIGISELAVDVRLGWGPSRTDADRSRPRLAYHVSSRSTAEVAQFDEVLRMVRQYSPNHRTLAEENSIELVVASHRERRKCSVFGQDESELARAPDGARAFDVRCTWQRALQLQVGAPSWPEDAMLAVDAPKQMAGVDRGANPQEYLLLGAASSFAEELLALAAAQQVELESFEVTASGTVDLRGIMRLDAGVSPKVQDIGYLVELTGAASASRYDELCGQALRASLGGRLLREAVECDTDAAHEHVAPEV